LDVTLHPVAALLGLALLERSRDRPHEPRIRRDSLAICGGLDSGLQRLRQAKRDPPGRLLAEASESKMPLRGLASRLAALADSRDVAPIPPTAAAREERRTRKRACTPSATRYRGPGMRWA